MPLRLSNMPGVVEWLTLLRDHGPHRRQEGRSGASARDHGLTDFWVRHIPSGRMMFLSTLKKKEASSREWYKAVDYGDGLEAITPEGRKALESFERSR
jgi:hypothetical protein